MTAEEQILDTVGYLVEEIKSNDQLTAEGTAILLEVITKILQNEPINQRFTGTRGDSLSVEEITVAVARTTQLVSILTQVMQIPVEIKDHEQQFSSEQFSSNQVSSEMVMRACAFRILSFLVCS